jgi:glycosyltransferase involved in cell wall biosynthesis
MSAEVQSLASHVLVHSREAQRLLAAEAPADAAPVDIVPFGVPRPPADPHPNRADRPLILCSGSISPAKALDAVIAAFAEVSSEQPGVRLLIAGHATEQRLAELRAQAERLRLGGSVEVLGRVGEDTYWELLRSATLNLQLRTASNGEASASVTDCFAARLPVLVSDLGWYAELPGDVAARIEPGFDAAELGAAITELLRSPRLLSQMSAAQSRYAEENSFRAVAEAYLRALGLSEA